MLHIYSLDLSVELAAHPVTWSRFDSYCAGQYSDDAPEKLPSAPVLCRIAQVPAPAAGLLSKFDFREGC